MKFMLDRRGKAWFRDFKVEAIEPWDENADVVVAMLGDSTDMASYLPEKLGVAYQLELLLRDRFNKSVVQVRNLAESGDWLGQLLTSGRLERELNTLPRCDVMVIRYGLNDNSKAEPEQFKQQLGEVCDRVTRRFPGVQIVIATTLPPRGQKFEDVTRAFAEERKLPLVDVAARFRDLAKQGVWNWHTGAGTAIGFDTHGDASGQAKALEGNIHPNAFGCRTIAETVFRTIEPVMAAKSGDSR
jgi:lysophospholipase L1-like esterase